MEIIAAEQKAQERTKTAYEYKNARLVCAKAEKELYTYLIAEIKNLRAKHGKIGIDIAITLLCADNEHAKEAYLKMKQYRHLYKGLNKIQDSLAGETMLAQSIWKADR